MPKAPIRDIITYYEEAGSGHPLLMITGLGADLQGWALQVPELAKHFRVITFDNRGAGRSSSPDRPYSIPQMAADAAALLDRLGIEKAHVLGFSMGGCIAQELALANPGRVEKLILLGTMPAVDGYARAVIRSWMDVRRSNMSREQIVRNVAPYIYSPELLDDEERFERAVLNSVSNPYAQSDVGFLRQAEALLGFDASARLGGMKAPALVVCGKDDMLVPPRNSDRLTSLISGATGKKLNGGHVGHVEYPSEYNAAFIEFLAAE